MREQLLWVSGTGPESNHDTNFPKTLRDCFLSVQRWEPAQGWGQHRFENMKASTSWH